MKFTVTFKDPDALDDQIREAVHAEVEDLGLSKEDAAAIEEARYERASADVSKWFKYGEYVTIALDTEADTATVVIT